MFVGIQLISAKPHSNEFTIRESRPLGALEEMYQCGKYSTDERPGYYATTERRVPLLNLSLIPLLADIRRRLDLSLLLPLRLRILLLPVLGRRSRSPALTRRPEAKEL